LLQAAVHYFSSAFAVLAAQRLGANFFHFHPKSTS
jgi:hypothetical protein